MNYNKLLLKTAFSCMACDGDIDRRELMLIKDLHKNKRAFGEINIDDEIDELFISINNDGHKFLKDFFVELSNSQLSNDEEIKLIEVAIDTIKADEKVEYSEIKFFKVIRSKLKISNESILSIHPDFEDYLEQDIISESYLAKVQADFFDTHTSSQFEFINVMESDIIKEIKSESESDNNVGK